MKIDELKALLQSQEAIENLTIEELNELIAAYPYMDQLRQIKAHKLHNYDGDGEIQQEAKLYRAYEYTEEEKHDVVDLDAQIVDDVKEPSADMELDVAAVVAGEQEVPMSRIINLAVDYVEVEGSEGEEAEELELQGSIVLDEDIDMEASAQSLVEARIEQPVVYEEVDEIAEIIERNRQEAEEEVEATDEAEGEPVADNLIIEEPEVEEPELEEEVVIEPVKLEMDAVTLEEIDENELVLMKAVKRAKKKKAEKEKVALKEKKKKKKSKDKKDKKDKVKGKKKNKKEGSKEKEDKRKETGEAKKGKKSDVKAKKKKDKKKKDKKKLKVKSGSYAEWLLKQKQIKEEGSIAYELMELKEGKKSKKDKKAKGKKKAGKTEKKAMKSVKKTKGVISERLAELLALQGHTNQAKLMYEELSLIYPEKSTYFAAQIENLDTFK